MTRLLFVCTGNTCRSPMAEVIARGGASRRGLAVEVASAGLAAAGGAPAADQAQQLAQGRGLDLSAHRSAALTSDLLESADLVLGLTDRHVSALRQALPGGPVHLITEFLPPTHDLSGRSIADPFGGDIVAYARAWAEIEVAVEAILEHLEDE